MDRNAFKQLLQRYVAGTANEEEKALVDHWFELLYNDSIEELNISELDSVEEEIWKKIEQEAHLGEGPASSVKTPVRNIIFKWAAAAAMLTGLTIGVYSVFPSPQKSFSYQQNKEKNKLDEVVNTSAIIKKVQLEDGSVITLNPSSKLAYPGRFAVDKREVYLEGDAFFEVTKNPSKPFLVHSGNLVTQVLGTSFGIKQDNASEKIIVSVRTGKVAVFENNGQISSNKNQTKNNGIIITPNQRGVYDKANRNFTTLLVESPEPVMYTDSDSIAAPISFVFDETNLSTVLENVSKMYAIEIMVENENIHHCRFSGDISMQSLYEKLELICQSTNNQYEIKGTKILIKGKGCN